MCGILGGYLQNGINQNLARNALDAIIHRGPDDFGIYSTHHGLIAMRRLSIIDIQGGHQPIFNEDKTIGIVFNGEIYNYKELIPELESRGHLFTTKSDTEVLIHLYEERGANMCQLLRGMFAFAVFDERDQSLFVARDRFGKKPLYYFQHNGEVFFASEIKALRVIAKDKGFPLEISDQAIYDYLSFGVVPQPSTIYKNVHCLPPGCSMTISSSGAQIREYWRLTYAPQDDLSFEEALEQTRTLLAEAVQLRLRSDVPLGVFLSGGVDSSVVAYEASRVLGEALQTFTVQMSDGEFDESPLAAQTAAMLGVRNTVLPLRIDPLETLQFLVRHYDQPFADSSAIPSLEISRLARQHVTVVLNGDGGDEIFGGYRRYVAASRAASFEWVPKELAAAAARGLDGLSSGRRSMLGFAARFARGVSYSGAERYLAWTSDMLLDADKRGVWRGGSVSPSERLIETEAQALQSLSGLNAQMALDIRFNLLSDLLVKMDMATMAHSLEGRSPFMDHVLAEGVARFPDRYKVSGTTKRVLREAYRGRLPDAVIEGAKKGFEIPLERWLTSDFKEIMHDLLNPSNARVNSYLDAGFVKALLKKEVLKDRNWKYLAYSVLILELWLRAFLD
jgi:asparagine synthase (glutamine-hydrolysing)